jgi:hypothetical protein
VVDNKQFHNNCWRCEGCKCELVGMGYHRLHDALPPSS